MYYFYILKCKDKSLYSGVTNDLEKREVTHNLGKGSKYVRARGGGKIVYSEKFRTLGKALKREAEVKKFSKIQKINLIINFMSKETILISGGVTGIGAATALEFLEDGWQVSVFSNVPDHNHQFLKLAKTQGLNKALLVLEGDITKEKDLKKVVLETKKKFKTIDVLFNNAGMGYFTDADKVDVKKFDQMMEVNVIGMADLTKQVLPIMKKQRKGQIINTSSIAGKVGHAKSEFYAASKSAVIQYSEGLRQEVGKWGIKVAVIIPGMVETGFWSAKEIARRKKEVWKGKMPARLSTTDIARLVRFIANQPEVCDIQDITIMPFAK